MRGEEEDVFGAEAFVQPAGSVELEDCFCQAEGDFEAAFEGDEGLAGDEATEGFVVPVEDLFRVVVIVVIRVLQACCRRFRDASGRICPR